MKTTVKLEKMGQLGRPALRSWLSLALALLLVLVPIGQVRGAGSAISPVEDLSANAQDVIIYGAHSNEYLGVIINTADFNGDGVHDLLMGAPGDNVNGSLAGAAFMVLGGSIPASIDLSQAGQADLTVYGPKPNGILGRSVAACDVNNDSFDDIIIGAQGIADGTDPGRVYVVLGGQNKFASPVVMNLANASGTKPELTIVGDQVNSAFGRAVACGDVNNDDAGDIIVGAYFMSPGGRLQAGATYVILGSTQITPGQNVTRNLASSPADLTIHGAEGKAAMAAPEPVYSARQILLNDAAPTSPTAGIGDRLGRSVTAGDVNHDGFEDIIVGAYGADVGANADAGKTYVFFGKATYAHETINLATDPGQANITITGLDAGDQAGFYVDAGDVTNNGYEDLIIGAYLSQGFNNAQGAQTGEVYIFEGRNLIGEKSVTTANSVIYGAAAGDRVGRSLASGDINGDGVNDVVVGASRADAANDRVDAGKVYVINGKASLTPVIQLSQANSADVVVLGASGSSAGDPSCDNEEANPSMDCADEAGHAVAVGDPNGDGQTDILIGAPYVNNGAMQDAGGIYVLYGPSSQAQHGEAVSIALTADVLQVKSGEIVTFQVTATDAQGVQWIVTQESTFSIQGGAGGSFSANQYTTGNVGSWQVTATYGSLTDSETLVVTASQQHGPAVAITLSPEMTVAGVGDQVNYTAIARDADNVTWDVTAETSFSIQSGAGGSFSGSSYTAVNVGTWTVTGTYNSLSDTASLQVLESVEKLYAPTILR